MAGLSASGSGCPPLDEQGDGGAAAPPEVLPEQDEETLALEALKAAVLAHAGVDTSQFKDKYVRRRLAVRMRALKLTSYASYLTYLREHRDELPVLMDKLTINVTEFYRNPPVWESLRTTVLPSIFARKGRGSIVRCWSAGCATGEETFSLALTLCDFLGADREGWEIVVRGTDIDKPSLATARGAVYPAESLRHAPPPWRSTYFEDAPDPRGQGQPHVKVALPYRDLAKFQYHDLFAGRPQRYFDLVLCRNVIIYFTKPRQEEVLQTLYRALVPGGVLILGKTESMVGAGRTDFQPLDIAERVYRRPPLPGR